MATEKEKMLSGALYNAADAELVAARRRARRLLQMLNASDPDSPAARSRLLADLFGAPTDAVIEPPFFCDYGFNLALGRNVFMNFNCVVLDVCPVHIGDNVLLGPAVQIYTATHPLDAATRRLGLESGKPVAIGPDVWIGGGAIICPGVTIGARAVIGAGSVVTRDVPEGAFAVGNPARVQRHLGADEWDA